MSVKKEKTTNVSLAQFFSNNIPIPQIIEIDIAIMYTDIEDAWLWTFPISFLIFNSFKKCDNKKIPINI